MKVFITGATGFLGTAVVRLLAQRGDAIVATARSTSNIEHLRAVPGLELCVDVPAEGLADRMSGCDGVIHIAGAAGNFYWDPLTYQRSNVELTEAVFHAARAAKVPRAVYCGTIVIPQGQRSPYALSKGQGMAAAQRIANGAIDVMTVHPSGMVGAEDRKPTPLGDAIKNVALHPGRSLSLQGYGGFVHVRDAAEMHVEALVHGEGGKAYLANAGYWTIGELLGMTAEAAGRPTPRVAPLALGKAVAAFEPVFRALRIEPPITKFTTEYLAQRTGLPTYGQADRDALGLGAYTPIDIACRDAVRWFVDHAPSVTESASLRTA